MLRSIFTALCLASLAACGLRIPGITPYRIEIQQGNFISQEMASQLKAGMSKDQVRLALGTPLLTDVFHADRWDYVYWREAPDGKRESRKFAVYFADGRLARVDGDIVPIDTKPPEPKPSPPSATQSPAAPATQSAVPAAPTPPAEETK